VYSEERADQEDLTFNEHGRMALLDEQLISYERMDLSRTDLQIGRPNDRYWDMLFFFQDELRPIIKNLWDIRDFFGFGAILLLEHA